MREAVIVSAVRTPLGSFNGALGSLGATDLGALVIQAAVQRAGPDRGEAEHGDQCRDCGPPGPKHVNFGSAVGRPDLFFPGQTSASPQAPQGGLLRPRALAICWHARGRLRRCLSR